MVFRKEESLQLCLTICAFRHPSLSEQEYYDYMVYAPLVKPFMEKYGVLKYSMTHTFTSTKSLMGHIVDSQFANIAEYDCVVQIVFRDIQYFVRMKKDPEYQRLVVPDHEVFADTKRSKMTIGYTQVLLEWGKFRRRWTTFAFVED
ncbi:hypothetical protein TESG_04132 [Trichophyton tonsurans CBS 112818]|uniref:EthD domain-containing protein n=1 Tax=Trichophyton tonsurans (strain CBS 112818) TaxID=647933 RepID=F2RZF1_TRIT1|nr:hypothetical protein TESG_04132 [Trichophyton tonsurans CBS 112818]